MKSEADGLFPANESLQILRIFPERLRARQILLGRLQELLLFLAVRLREGRTLPQPRDFTKEEMDAWIAEDEADMESFRRGE